MNPINDIIYKQQKPLKHMHREVDDVLPRDSFGCKCGFNVEKPKDMNQIIDHLNCDELSELYSEEFEEMNNLLEKQRTMGGKINFSYLAQAFFQVYKDEYFNYPLKDNKMVDEGEALINNEIAIPDPQINNNQDLDEEAFMILNIDMGQHLERIDQVRENAPEQIQQEKKEEEFTIVQIRKKEDEIVEVVEEEIAKLELKPLEKIPSEKKERCKYCNLEFTQRDELNLQDTITLKSTGCFHSFHKACFELASFQAWRKQKDMKCPVCEALISEIEVQNLLCAEQIEPDIIPMPMFQRITSDENRHKLEEFLETLNIATCPCGNMMEVVEGEIDRNLRDELGRPLREDALLDFAKHRIRCHHCNNNFCSHCKTQPYHLGFTCEQFKDIQDAAKCRYCQQKLVDPSISELPAFKHVCRDINCLALMDKQCNKVLACSHPCCGFLDEADCLPCLHSECVKLNAEATLSVDQEQFCTICYTDSLGQAPCVQFKCKHVFHLDCMISKLKLKWNGPRINFAFLDCPQCNQKIDASHCPKLNEVLQVGYSLLEQVKVKALERAKYEGLDKDERLNKAEDVFYNNLQDFALFKLSFYECFKCKLPFYGGMRDCGEEINNQQQNQNNFNPEELVCGFCASIGIGAGMQHCEKHGDEFIEFKCKYCCTMACWFCWGTTHFCEPCHQVAGNNETKACLGEEQCPLKGMHPPNGSEDYALGCGICRQEYLAQQQNQDNV